MQVDGLKAADRNGSQQIIHPNEGELAGLKTLVSAGQSRPSPPFLLSPPTSFAHVAHG
jgi:hypothetical protein